MLEVIEDAEPGWMKGKLRSTGRVGLFPTNFVQFSGLFFLNLILFNILKIEIFRIIFKKLSIFMLKIIVYLSEIPQNSGNGLKIGDMKKKFIENTNISSKIFFVYFSSFLNTSRIRSYNKVDLR